MYIIKCGIKISRRDVSKRFINHDSNSSAKRSFSYLRHLILIALLDGTQSINQVSNNSGINWKTVENHMPYLVGKGFVNTLHRSNYLTLCELTEKGRKYLDFLKKRYQKKHVHQLDLGNIDKISEIEKEFFREVVIKAGDGF
ncbi:MAG: winged helix-turn-helix domain-containing protein [Candidatus Woesearchaeota archaeon]